MCDTYSDDKHRGCSGNWLELNWNGKGFANQRIIEKTHLRIWKYKTLKGI